VQVAFLGTSEYAASVLRRLGGSPHELTLAITPPDRPRGRGRRLSSPPAAEAARELGVELLQTGSVNDPEAFERLRAAQPDVAVVCAFGQLIREPLLSELELLNVHPSLLPRWRGAAPIERAIMAGDEETGVTIMRVTAGLDSGPITLQERMAIAPDDDFGSLSARLAELGGELIVSALDLRAAGELSFTEQDDSRATYAEKIAPSERRLDPGRPAVELERVVRALTPHIGAFLELDGGARLGVREAFAEDGAAPAGDVRVDDGSLLLGCGRGLLRLAVLQPPGRRPMPADAYLRGHAAPRLAV
jgi:methionyl-tRNA formyltransferase